MNPKVINILTSPDSWVNEYLRFFTGSFENRDFSFKMIDDSKKIKPNSFITLLLGYYKIIPKDHLSLSKINCCFHESNLPKGRGWAPLTWQIIEGSNVIPLRLFSVEEDKVDSGVIFGSSDVLIDRTDLIEDIRLKLVKGYIDMFGTCLDDGFQNFEEQHGTPTYYSKRTPSDSELDVSKSIIEQFNLIRVCDKKRYPLFFKLNKVKYKLVVSKFDEGSDNE